MSKIDISIIIPIYNDEKNISKCLDSIFEHQQGVHYEVICIDDGSNDSTPYILNKYKKSYSNITVITQKNMGLSNARNVGMMYANGEYIYFVDSDDILKDNMLNFIFNILKKNDLDLLFFSFESFSDDEENEKKYWNIIHDIKRKYKYPDKTLNGKQIFVLFQEVDEYLVMVWQQIVRKQILLDNNIRFYDNIIFEDNIYTFQVLMVSTKVMCINDILYRHRIRSNSITTRAENVDSVTGWIITFIEIEKIYFLLQLDKYSNCNKVKFQNAYNVMLENIKKQIVKRYNRLSNLDQKKLMIKLSNSQMNYLIDIIKDGCK